MTTIGQEKLQLMLLLVVITIIWIAYEIYLMPKGRYTIETNFTSWKTDEYHLTADGYLVFKTHLGEEIEIRGKYTIKDSESK
jgi:uncharacterized ion transporter superfamily protein YfcC